MFYLRLAQGGIVEVPDAVSAELDGEALILRAQDGHVVCRLERNDVLAYSARLDLLLTGKDKDTQPGPGS